MQPYVPELTWTSTNSDYAEYYPANYHHRLNFVDPTDHRYDVDPLNVSGNCSSEDGTLLKNIMESAMESAGIPTDAEEEYHHQQQQFDERQYRVVSAAPPLPSISYPPPGLVAMDDRHRREDDEFDWELLIN